MVAFPERVGISPFPEQHLISSAQTSGFLSLSAPPPPSPCCDPKARQVESKCGVVSWWCGVGVRGVWLPGSRSRQGCGNVGEFPRRDHLGRGKPSMCARGWDVIGLFDACGRRASPDRTFETQVTERGHQTGQVSFFYLFIWEDGLVTGWRSGVSMEAASLRRPRL